MSILSKIIAGDSTWTPPHQDKMWNDLPQPTFLVRCSTGFDRHPADFTTTTLFRPKGWKFALTLFQILILFKSMFNLIVICQKNCCPWIHSTPGLHISIHFSFFLSFFLFSSCLSVFTLFVSSFSQFVCVSSNLLSMKKRGKRMQIRIWVRGMESKVEESIGGQK